MQLTTTAELLKKFRIHCYISTDSRKVMPGSLFFALKGDNFNANSFAMDALNNGAAYAVIDDPQYYTGEKTLLVENVLDALQSLATAYRSLLRIPIIGITGTNGKTTTKELLAAVLSRRFNTVATPGNFNNHIGVPLTLLSIKPDTEIAVVEMGANHQGEIAHLSKIAMPTHGIITNIGKAHLEGFGGYEGVKVAKKELYDYLNQHGGTIFVNSGNDLLMQFSANSFRITYGQQINDVVSGLPENDDQGYMVINLDKPIKRRIQTQLAGSYNFENAMAALTIGLHFRVDFNEAIDAVSTYKPDMNRSQMKRTDQNLLILDAYNANPSSMKLAIDNFSKLNASRKIIILGDMFELGNESKEEHEQVLKLAEDCKFHAIYTAGPYFFDAAKERNGIKSFVTTEELKEELLKNTPKDATILIKGSRGMKLEIVTPVL